MTVLNAFLGFGVITFRAKGLGDPARQLPRAVYLALGIATTVYVAVGFTDRRSAARALRRSDGGSTSPPGAARSGGDRTGTAGHGHRPRGRLIQAG
jgi:hypothetical protein